MAGKYDKYGAALREELQADALFLLVENGSQGSGMSCCFHASESRPQALRYHATVLALMADDLRRQADRLEGRNSAH